MDINQQQKPTQSATSNAPIKRTMRSDLNQGAKFNPPQSTTFQPTPSAQGEAPSNFHNQSFMPEEKPNSTPSPFLDTSFSNRSGKEVPKLSESVGSHSFEQPFYPPQQQEQNTTQLPSKETAEFLAPRQKKETAAINIPSASDHSKLKTASLIGLLLLVIGLLGLGGYYFWLRNSEPENSMTLENALPSSKETAPTPTPSSTTGYSNEHPNYLSIDTETITPENLNGLFSEASEKIPQNSAFSRPTEFIVTDKNNNPLAFSRFALISGLSFPQEVLENLEESFSLFISRQPQSTRPRMGIAVELKNREALISSIRLREPQLATDLKPLFLKTIPTSLVGEFRDGVYQGIPVRYLNLNQQEDLSIDYTVSSSNLLIGTSKEVLRSIIDLNR